GVVSLTLTPMMCARFLHKKNDFQENSFYRTTGRWFDAVIARYGRALEGVLDRQVATVLVAAGTPGRTVVLYLVVPKVFLPGQPNAVPVHPRGRRRRIAGRVGAETDAAPELAARAHRYRLGPAEPGAAGIRGHRPRQRRAPGHHARGHRYRALQRFRAAPDLDDLHPGDAVSRGTRGEARVPRRSGRAEG